MSPDTLYVCTNTGGSITDAIVSLIGLGGVIVAGLSVYFSYKWRNAAIRDHLYEKQISIISNIMPMVSEFLFRSTALYECKDTEELVKLREELKSSDEITIGKLQNAYFEAEPFIPKEILKKLYTFMLEITGLVNPSDLSRALPEKKCVEYYWDLVNAIRKEYRIDELTKEYQKLLPRQ